MLFDTIILGAKVFDGSNRPPNNIDIGIKDGLIQKLGHLSQASAQNIIDAKGKWVTPGFIDIHTHYDAEIEAYPGLAETVKHGVSTVVIGNCSISLSAGREEDISDLFARVENLPDQVLDQWVGGKVTWKKPSEYFDHLDSVPLGPNVAAFIGHSNIRLAALEKHKALTRARISTAEKQKMGAVLQDALDAGFLGMSIDMLPWHRMFGSQYDGASIPSQNARTSEYKFLANILRKKGRVLQATPNANKKQSVLTLAWMSGGILRRPLKITALAAMDFRSNRLLTKLTSLITFVANDIFRGNFRFQSLATAFDVWSDGCNTPMFEEFSAGARLLDLDSSRDRKSLLSAPHFRQEFKRQWNRKFGRSFHRDLDSMKIVASPVAAHVGQSFGSLALRQKVDATDYFMDLLKTYDEKIRWVATVANDRPKVLRQLLKKPYNFPGFSDAGAHNRNMAFQHAHLCLIRDSHIHDDAMPVQEAVYRLTGELADWLGIDTGYIEEGKKADICIIDPDKLASDLSAPIERPDPKANGEMRMVTESGAVVSHVIINGKFAKRDGELSNDLDKEPFGRLLRSQLN